MKDVMSEIDRYIVKKRIPIMMIPIHLKYCTFEVWPERRLVSTIFPNGAVVSGTRENNQQNITEAESQGYTGENIVWRSLVHHELLHSLVAEVLFDQPSKVLETEAGVKFHPSWERCEEEAIVLALQYYFNTNSTPVILIRLVQTGYAVSLMALVRQFRKIVSTELASFS